VADLISRAASLERMKSMAGCATCDNYNGVRCRACIWDDAMNIVEEMSEVEVAPVVRCKDCRHRGCNAICVKLWVGTKDSFFCAFGERRGKANEGD